MCQGKSLTLKAAIFFDRDGTLIESVHYLNDPDQVQLIEGVADVLNRLEQAGYLRIVVTNQAAIGKGLLTVCGLSEIHSRIEHLLGMQGASIDGWYFCPEIRLSQDMETIDHPDRKPGPCMLLKAAQDFHISLADSWMVGDTLSDSIAGRNAGCKGTILIETGLFKSEYRSHPGVDYVVPEISRICDIAIKVGEAKDD